MLNETVLNTRGRPMMNWRKLYRQAGEVLDRLHIELNVRKLVQDLTLAEKQMVLIARAIQSECSFLILDEPTAPPERHRDKGTLQPRQAPARDGKHCHHIYFPPDQ